MTNNKDLQNAKHNNIYAFVDPYPRSYEEIQIEVLKGTNMVTWLVILSYIPIMEHENSLAYNLLI